ncbi:MAG: hypothetical protein PHN89_04380 [Candidatus Pacebacteria bacterium]|nr:hypothetical protein [Candidatus Paceibacterota bacterium]
MCTRYGLKPYLVNLGGARNLRIPFAKRAGRYFVMTNDDAADALIQVCKQMRELRAKRRVRFVLAVVLFTFGICAFSSHTSFVRGLLEDTSFPFSPWAWVWGIVSCYFGWIMARREALYREKEDDLFQDRHFGKLFAILKIASSKV